MPAAPSGDLRQGGDLREALASLKGLRRELKAYFIEREEIVDGALAGLLSGEHVLLLGPVGTAKSMLARTVCERISAAAFFGWLLTKFSTPEELFGPVSLKALEQDEFRRMTEDKLPSAHIVFLDEIFKANSAILNSLLAVMNERVYHNGRRPERVPLLTLFAASNELPEEGELMALYDRFLLRFRLDYIIADEDFLRLLELDAEPASGQTLTLDQLRLLQQHTRQVHIPKALLRDLTALRNALNQASIEASDRRYKKALDVLRAYALLDGRDRVSAADLAQLQHVLWAEPEERLEVAAKIDEVARRFELACQSLRERAETQFTYATRYWPSEEARVAAAVESMAKLRRLLEEADRLIRDTSGRDDQTESQLRTARGEIEELVEQLLHTVGRGQAQ